jgi:cobalt-zinc-cadmium efflux system protein
MGHAHHGEEVRSIQLAFFLNLGFALLEVAGGLWTNSLAILTDALHDLGDSFALGVAWLLGRHAQKSGDAGYSYGYRRYSLVGALTSTIVLILGSAFVLSEAVPRLLSPEHSNAQGMLLFAVAGIAVNGFAALRLREGKTLNARVISWHLLEDVLGWGAVLVVSILLLFTDIHILDPILAILITVYILYNVFGNLRKTVRVFLQAVPHDVDLSKVERQVNELERVCSTHHVHAWSLDGEHNVLTMHVVVEQTTSLDEFIAIKCEINDLIDSRDFVHSTIEIELEDEDCRMKAD